MEVLSKSSIIYHDFAQVYRRGHSFEGSRFSFFLHVVDSRFAQRENRCEIAILATGNIGNMQVVGAASLSPSFLRVISRSTPIYRAADKAPLGRPKDFSGGCIIDGSTEASASSPRGGLRFLSKLGRQDSVHSADSV